MAAVQETLKINITADNKDAVASLQMMQNELVKLRRSLKKATDTNDIQALQMKIQSLNGSITAASAQFVKTSDAVKKSSTNYQNFGRVIQDLPFGFQGIQNNLTQLVPSVGALGLAFSGVVAAITFAQVGLSFWNRGSKEAKKNTDELKKSQEEYAQSLAEEKVQLDVLFTSVSNANIPLQARKKAIQDLRDNYGNYLKDFSDEELLAGKAAKAYDALSVAIIKAAKARAAQSMLQKNVERQLLLEIELANVAKKAQEDASKVTQAIKAGGNQIGGFQKFTSVQEQQSDVFAIAAGKAKELAKEYEGLADANKALLQTVQDNQIIPLSLDKAAKSAKNYNTELKKIVENTILFQGQRRDPLTALPERARAGGAPTKISDKQELDKNIIAGFRERNDEAVKYKETLESIYGIANNIGNAFISAFEAGKTFGEALTDVITNLVKQLAAALIKAALFKIILGAFTGGVGPAFGDLFKSFAGIGVKPFADGGVVNKPTLGVFGEAGSEAIMPLSKLDSMLQTASQLGGSSMSDMSLNTKISGTDLLLWIQRSGYATNLKR